MNPNEVLARNIQYYLDRKGITQTQMAHSLGFPEMTVSNWLNKKTYPRIDRIQQMADFFNVRRSDLTDEHVEKHSVNSNEYNYFPTAISAGQPFTVDGQKTSLTLSVPDELMGKHAGDREIFFARINGDSMNNVMEDDSLIAIKPIPIESLINGDIVVYSDGYDYSVKHYFKYDKTLVFKANSTNIAHQDQVYNTDDNITIHGKVVTYIVNMD